MPSIGAHVKGGIKSGVANALEIKAESMQIFVGSPQMWREAKLKPDEIAKFRADVVENGLGPVFVHGIYLVNLASGREDFYEKSITSMKSQLHWTNEIGATGLIFHPGSAGTDTYENAVGRVVQGLETILDGYDGNAKVMLEVCAGQGETIGDRFEEMADIIGAMGKDKRLAICWDTCHLLNAGFDICTEDGLEETIDSFERIVGFDRLLAVHANDSKNPLGARVDRHENIGKGYIGEEAFARMLEHPALSSLPWILEVPGYDKQGPDLPNIQMLRHLAGLPNTG